MSEQGITREMAAAVLACPRTWYEGYTANEYEAMVNGRRLYVVLSVRPRPGIVITAYWLAR